jgi:hypothetical protein
MATGALAYDLLARKNPDVIMAITALIAQHPDRPRFDATLRELTGAARERTLFELIARWPDDIRNTAYNHTHWHHQLRVVAGWKIFRPARLGAADHAFFRTLHILRDQKARSAERAVALCWLIHIFGDMHQPLHAGHRMDARYPLTDRAGTLGWVRRSRDAAPETFHQFWDQAADRPGAEAAGADALAQIAAAAIPATEAGPAFAPEVTYRAAVRESEMLAAQVAYQGAGLTESPQRDTAPVLPPDYVAAAGTLAEQRIGLAGRRLADILAMLFATASPPAAMLHPEQ